MNERSIRELIGRRPFQTFQVRFSSGETDEVRHPEIVLLTKSRMVIANLEIDSVIFVALLHIGHVAFPQAAWFPDSSARIRIAFSIPTVATPRPVWHLSTP